MKDPQTTLLKCTNRIGKCSKWEGTSPTKKKISKRKCRAKTGRARRSAGREPRRRPRSKGPKRRRRCLPRGLPQPSPKWRRSTERTRWRRWKNDPQPNHLWTVAPFPSFMKGNPSFLLFLTLCRDWRGTLFSTSLGRVIKFSLKDVSLKAVLDEEKTFYSFATGCNTYSCSKGCPMF